MRVRGVLLFGLLAACQASTSTTSPPLTDAQRAEIATAVRKVMDDMYAGAREVNAEKVFAHAAKADGLCLLDMDISTCSDAFKGFRDAWRPDRADRLQRQEMDGVEIRIIPLGPTVALAAATIKENRAFLPGGKVERARFASFSVFVLEDGLWKMHSGQQASWPIDAPPAK